MQNLTENIQQALEGHSEIKHDINKYIQKIYNANVKIDPKKYAGMF